MCLEMLAKSSLCGGGRDEKRTGYLKMKWSGATVALE